MRANVAYLISTYPGAVTTFTADEVQGLRGEVNLIPLALVGEDQQAGWHVSPAVGSFRLLKSTAMTLALQPRAASGAIGPIIRIAFPRMRDLAIAIRAFMAACYLAREVDVDLVHAQFIGPAAAAAFVVNRLTGVPYTVRAHAYDIYRPYAWAGLVARSSARVIAISEHGREEIARQWSIDAALIKVGIDAAQIRKRPHRPPGSPFRILSVGSLSEKKGHDLAISAVASLLARGHAVSLDIYGDGPLRAELSRQAEMCDGIRLLGHVESSLIRDGYAGYDAFLMASRIARDGDRDGIPVALMEAAAASVPIIATDVAGISELIDNETGYLAEPDAPALANAIAAVMATYSDALHRAELARLRVETQHHLSVQCRQLARLWSELTINK